jgi:hypothetical protein
MVVLRRHHHDYGILVTLHAPELLEKGETVFLAHEDVQKHEIGVVILQIIEGFRGGLEGPQVHGKGSAAEFVQGD